MRWHSQPIDIILQATKTQNDVTNASHINIPPSSAPVADEIYHKVGVAKAATLASQAHTPVLARGTASEKSVAEPIDDSACRAPLCVAKEIADVIPSKCFLIFLLNLSNMLVHIPKRIIMAKETASTPHIIANEAALLKTDSETIGALHYKP